VIIHLVALFYSVGHLQSDEHFQILEFLGFKLGLTPEEDLAWEYPATMRPWIQPFIYYWVVIPLKAAGLNSPFFWTLVFRLISVAIGVISSLYLIAAINQSQFKHRWQQNWHCYLVLFLWFTPFIHARLSSEGVGSSVFVLGFALLLLKRNYILVGIVFGVAFLLRYHIGLMIASLYLWLIFVQKERVSKVGLLVVGTLVAVGFGVIVDYWGYGQWVFTPWEYVYQNLIQDKASSFGVSPWWAYFKDVVLIAIPPYSVIIIFSFLYLWVKKPLSLFSWLTLPFFLVHCLIAHKEWRFLFPLVPFIPFAVISTIGSMKKGVQIKLLALKKSQWGSLFWKLFLMGNFALLVALSFKAVHPSYNFFVHANTSDRRIENLYYWHYGGPYKLAGLNQNFYRYPTEIEQFKITNADDLEGVSGHVFVDSTWKVNEVLKIERCGLEYTEQPAWLTLQLKTFLEDHESWTLENISNWTLFYCE